jgi:hypothetical protein
VVRLDGVGIGGEGGSGACGNEGDDQGFDFHAISLLIK